MSDVEDGAEREAPGRPPVNDREFMITRVLPAAPEAVFDFWTDPAHISEWWGPDGFSTTTESMDLRPGGAWLFTMHGPDGRDYGNHVEFIEVSRPSYLSYRHSGRDVEEPVGFYATVSFAPVGQHTLLTMRVLFDTPEDLARVEEANGASVGQQQTLNRFAERFAARAGAGTGGGG